MSEFRKRLNLSETKTVVSIQWYEITCPRPVVSVATSPQYLNDVILKLVQFRADVISNYVFSA